LLMPRLYYVSRIFSCTYVAWTHAASVWYITLRGTSVFPSYCVVYACRPIFHSESPTRILRRVEGTSLQWSTTEFLCVARTLYCSMCITSGSPSAAAFAALYLLHSVSVSAAFGEKSCSVSVNLQYIFHYCTINTLHACVEYCRTYQILVSTRQTLPLRIPPRSGRK
jgi:hypothetical protein